MRRAHITLDRYYDICMKADISPNYHPDFIDFYFTKLKKKPKIVGKFDRHGQLIAAYPVLFGQIFPNPLHKRLLNQKFKNLGDIGQPEILFPVLHSDKKLSLNCFSPVTSPILYSKVRRFRRYSLKSIAIAKKTKHKNATRSQRQLFNDGGKVYFSDQIEKKDFADIYIKLHCQRWSRSPNDFKSLRDQIFILYDHIQGSILTLNNEPIAAQLCFKMEGQRYYYVDFINIGVKPHDKKQSFGSVIMLLSLRKAEEQAQSIGKHLRFSFGYYYGPQDYKNLWADHEPTFIGF